MMTSAKLAPFVFDISTLDYAANCSTATQWLQSTRFGPANFSNTNINADFLRTSLPQQDLGYFDAILSWVYGEMAEKEEAGGSDWYVNATTTIWQQCCNQKQQDDVSGLPTFNNTAIGTIAAACQPYALDLSEFDFTRNCTLAGQWLFFANNSNSDEYKTVDTYDYDVLLESLSIELMRSSWPHGLPVLRDVHISIWLNDSDASDATNLPSLVGTSVLDGSCVNVVCEKEGLTGSAGLDGIGVSQVDHNLVSVSLLTTRIRC